jgi:hypothetical protein
VTLSELAIELFYALDEFTTAVLRYDSRCSPATLISR